MAFNGSGVFNRIFSWTTDKTNNIPVTASRMDQECDGFATGLSTCLTKDGQQINAANQNFGGFRLTNLGTGTALTDAPTVTQVQNNNMNWAIAGGTADVITLTLSPVPSAISQGQLVGFRATAANATTMPTISVNGSPAFTITKDGGLALVAGDIPGSGAECLIRLNSVGFELLNPATSTKAASVAASSVTNAGLANMAAWTLKGNNTGSSAAPSDFTITGLTSKASPTTADELMISDAAASNAFKKATLAAIAATAIATIAAPTVQRFTSGSGTYTPTSGTVRIRVRMCAGGGGGGGPAGSGSGGGSSGGAGGTGGSNSTGTLITRIPGGNGQGGLTVGGTVDSQGGQGGSNPFGGNGGGGSVSVSGTAGATNSGAGGGGGAGAVSTSSGAGGGAGEYAEFWMTAAQIGASQSYTVGAAGAAGSTGGAGGAGQIIVEESYF